MSGKGREQAAAQRGDAVPVAAEHPAGGVVFDGEAGGDRGVGQDTLHDSPLRSGLTFAAYAVGFAAASLTWTRLPAAWRDRFPACGFAAVAAGTGLLALATSRTGWPPAATLLLAVAGAGHGSGSGALVQRTAAVVPIQYAAAFSGMLSTVNQLAIAVGIAATATIYQAAHSA